MGLLVPHRVGEAVSSHVQDWGPLDQASSDNAGKRVGVGRLP